MLALLLAVKGISFAACSSDDDARRVREKKLSPSSMNVSMWMASSVSRLWLLRASNTEILTISDSYLNSI